MFVICKNGHVNKPENYTVHEDDWTIEKLSKIHCPDCHDKVELYLCMEPVAMIKEEIIAYADNEDYIHADHFETSFEGERFIHNIFTKRTWNGKVKITIEQL